jgi:uncharacterized damage-inducible protein DinB
MPGLTSSIAAEYRRYKALGQAAIAQLDEADLTRREGAEDNSIATIVWHIAGNLRSRFSDFRTSDGEKPWRERDEEFEERIVGRDELLAKWESGWDTLFAALDALTDEDLVHTVTIRGRSYAIHEALHRSLAHTSYHVGQIVHLAKSFRGASWRNLSIPKGGSRAYNENPHRETADAHAEVLRAGGRGGPGV